MDQFKIWHSGALVCLPHQSQSVMMMEIQQVSGTLNSVGFRRLAQQEVTSSC